MLITGAAGGIGGATARTCARMGAQLVLADLVAPEALAQEFREGGAKARCVGFDVCDRAKTEAIVAEAAPLDAVVINAGFCPWDDWNEQGWDAVFDKTIAVWPAAGFVDTERRCFMKPEVGYGEASI